MAGLAKSRRAQTEMQKRDFQNFIRVQDGWGRMLIDYADSDAITLAQALGDLETIYNMLATMLVALDNTTFPPPLYKRLNPEYD
jgi:hypothetical protein